MFSLGAINAITLLKPRKSPSGTAIFPILGDWEDVVFRVNSTESLGEWFRRIIGSDERAAQRLDACEITRGLALFGSVTWNEERITFLRLQALVVRTPNENSDVLSQLIQGDLDNNDRTYYYRLDFEPNQPGALFSHSMPHLHCNPNGEPRVPFQCSSQEFLPNAFLEFIYLNHFYDDWLEWARKVVTKNGLGNEMEDVIEAFKSGGIVSRFDELNETVTDVRRILNEEKRRFTRDVYALTDIAESLNYVGGPRR
jgi:hypothetical protein